MDPFSLTANIIAVLQLCGTVIGYLSDVKDASKDCYSILLEVSSVTGLLYALRDLIDRDIGDGYLDVARSLAVPYGPLDQFKTTLEKLSKQLQPATGVRKAARVLRWPFKKEEVKDLLSTIERQKTLFSLALQNDQVRLSRGIESDVVDIRRTVQQLELRSRSGEDHTMLSWFTPLQPEKTHLDTRERRLPGTGEWLLQKSEFKAWRDDTTASKVLWCHGIPGAGKTILSSLVFDHLTRQLPKECAVTVFYCDYREQGSQSTFDIVASMLKQLASLSPVVMEMMRQSYKNCSLQGLHDRLFFSELDSLFREACGQFTQVYLVIDALDECDPKDHRKPFLEWIRSLDFCRVFLTSRPHPDDLKKAFKSHPQITIEASNDDIEKYLRATIAGNDNAADIMDDNLVQHVVTTITENAQGMFLLPQLQIQAILNETTRRGMRQALKELPPSLNDNLGKTLARIKEQPARRAELALKTLEWIFLAERPFSINELCQGLSVNPGDICADEDGYPLPKHMVDYCLGLVALDEASKTIRLVHFTVQEYLDNAATEIFADLGDGLTHTCLTFLAFDEFKKGPCPCDEDFEARKEMHPFFEYAAQYWAAHLRGHPNAMNDQLANNFLKHGTCVLSICQETERRGGDHGGYSQRFMKYSALHLAAKEGLTAQAKFMLESGINVNISDGKTGTALHLAAAGCYCEIATLLVQHGADVSLLDEDSTTALHIAARAGSLEIVQLLLEAKADMAAPDGLGKTALHLAVEEHHEDVSNFLIKEGMDVTAEDQFGETILHTAAEAGDEALMKLILEKGSDVNALDDSLETAAHRAASGGFEEILRMLHAHGANMDGLDDGKTSPLHRAASSGYFRSMRFLVECGADPKRRDLSGDSVLHEAARGGNIESVQFLLDCGADINAKNGEGESVLHTSCGNEDEDVFMFLVEHGAVTGHGDAADAGSLLLTASSHGSERIVRYLVERGADIAYTDSESNTPLHAAADSGHDAIVTYLISQGADVKKKGWGGSTVLYEAAASCTAATIRLILDQGADANAKCLGGKTALHQATTSREKIDIAMLLIESGADVNAKDEDGMTVLHEALECGNEELVPILIAHGADVTAKDNSGRGAWFYATEGTFKKTVFELLSEKGAKHDEPDKAGIMPLHLAVERDNGALIRYLLENGADVRATANNGAHILHFLYSGDEVDIVELLISKGADPNAKIPKSGISVLGLLFGHCAGEIDMVKTLVENGADVNATTTDGLTVLHRAAENASAEVLRYLIDRGARVDAKSKAGTTVLSKVVENGDAERCTMLLAEKGADLEERDKKGRTTLLAAADTYSNRALIRYLVESGANVKARNSDGNSILHSESVLRALSLTKYLLDKEAPVNALNKLGVSPLHIAVENGYLDTVRLLVDRGASPIGIDKARVSALCRAASMGETAIAAYLIEKGANVNHCDKDGMAPLHYAVEKRHQEVARLLLEKGAKINARVNTGATVLHKAVMAANTSIVRDLLDRGAETHWKENDNGFTVLHWAVNGDLAVFEKFRSEERLILSSWGTAREKAQRQKIVEALKIKNDVAMARVLLEHGSDINAVNANGETALKMAVKENLSKMIVLLLQHGARTDVGTEDGEDDGDIVYDLSFLEAEMWIREQARGNIPESLRETFGD